MPEWMKNSEFKEDIVVSTRVRLARNVKGVAFPNKIRSKAEVNHIVDIAKKSFLDHSDFSFIDFSKVNNLEKLKLYERYLISHEFAKKNYSGLILSRDERLSIMILEEDHYRLQCIMPSLNIDAAFKYVDEMDNMLALYAKYAFIEKLGYLSACPTNVGTGMRVSVMMNLPALNLSGEIKDVIKNLKRIGQTCRGAFGEGSNSLGDLFQISNEVTLGYSELEILESVTASVNEIIAMEKETQKKLYMGSPSFIEDRIFRAHGVLKNARVISSKEMLQCISYVNMGASLGLIAGVDMEKLYALVIDTRPANLISDDKEVLDEKRRDIKRADIVRRYIK
jgi:protein arginine kinase